MAVPLASSCFAFRVVNSANDFGSPRTPSARGGVQNEGPSSAFAIVVDDQMSFCHALLLRHGPMGTCDGQDAGGFRGGRGSDRRGEHLRAPIRFRTPDLAAARLPTDPPDVAERGAHLGPPLHGHLRRPPLLWPQRVPRLRPGPCAV